MPSVKIAASLKQLALKGAVWTLIGYGASQILRFGSNLILTHLLFPELFGLMTLVYVFIAGLNLFSDIGIGPSIIQNKRGDEPEFLNTAWTLQIVRGLALWVGCCVLAYPIAQLYGEPKLLWLLPVVGLNTVISGFHSTSLFTLNRHLSIKALTLFEFASQLVAVVVMLILAYFSKTIWVLIAGGFATAVFQLIVSHRLHSGVSNRFAWDRSALQELGMFGRWVFLSTAFTFLGLQADKLIIGKLFSFEFLGVYGVAFTLADVPRQVVYALSGKVVFPTYAKLAELPREELRSKIKQIRKPLLLIVALGLPVLVGGGDLLVTALYDDRYSDASWMLPILGLGIWFTVLYSTIDPVFLAIGQPRYLARVNFYYALAMVGGIPLGFAWGGEMGAIAAISSSSLIPYLVTTYNLHQEKLACIGQEIKMSILLLTVLSAIVVGRSFAGLSLPGFV